MIRGLCVVKDEVDVIGEMLQRALEWCDRIYALDNGSSDGTWETLQEAAARSPEAITLDRYHGAFTNTLRGKLFNTHRMEAEPRDWWCYLDADEFYIDDPRSFLGRVPRRYRSVWSASLQYYFTDLDLVRYEEDPRQYSSAISIEERLRYYINNWSEMRFFRHSSSVRWGENHPGPTGVTPTFPNRIRLKHFQYRSPEQISKRLQARSTAPDFPHERRGNWKENALLPPERRLIEPATERPDWTSRVMNSVDLDHDEGDGSYVLRPELMPELPNTSRGRELVHRLARRLKR